MTASVCPFGRGFDFTGPDVLQQGLPVAQPAQLRKTAPVWWNEQPAGATVFDDGGHWVSRLFTPRSVAAMEEKLAVAARDIVAAAAEKDPGNFVDDIAMQLPCWRSPT